MHRKVKLLDVELVKVSLVPFADTMIEKYHEWMQNSELLEETGSKAMSLEEVKDIFFTYQTDPNKYAYMLCDRSLYNRENPGASMVGDVTLFINERLEGEICIFLADTHYRKLGIASEVIQFMISLCGGALSLSKLIAKISENNLASQKLFKKMGFSEFARDLDMREVHYYYMLSHSFTF
ncbi:hypothetical protein SteCoe_3646 [Stentor coeruleus]|uniref:N-acetyltransferase domain-containing protein n=1 Tax=Stentor coeruleus TaxID=5963 RepID=A0A1R2CWQ1_9CILI|nr:hypothetical protein SteCoe_3646 [Stentor coeruleus]